MQHRINQKYDTVTILQSYGMQIIIKPYYKTMPCNIQQKNNTIIQYYGMRHTLKTIWNVLHHTICVKWWYMFESVPSIMLICTNNVNSKWALRKCEYVQDRIICWVAFKHISDLMCRCECSFECIHMTSSTCRGQRIYILCV